MRLKKKRTIIRFVFEFVLMPLALILLPIGYLWWHMQTYQHGWVWIILWGITLLIIVIDKVFHAWTWKNLKRSFVRIQKM